MSGRYVSKEQKKRIKESLKYSYPDKRTRPHFTIFEDFVYNGRDIYHSNWPDKPLTFREIEILGIDSLRNYFLQMNAERL